MAYRCVIVPTHFADLKKSTAVDRRAREIPPQDASDQSKVHDLKINETAIRCSGSCFALTRRGVNRPDPHRSTDIRFACDPDPT
ncbi:hypothetical protein BVRB_2g036830 [Beta vulgaris subsp. vulgaris]|uniref:Uncharacterized protein n=1 Tax=Beta vulgaris subsp. vulgaris TaxID=3555 RepID=A0A0J8CZQ6_BETVV|nr:hypothetical protein BVRB_2g036830 [Beta vulgaris subsp. vulgaris]